MGRVIYYITIHVCQFPYFFDKSSSLVANISQEELLASDT